MGLIFNKGGKNIQRRKDSLFSKQYWESWTAACKSMKLECTLTPHTKIHSKCLKDSKTRQDIILKIVEENKGKTFSAIKYTNVFLGQSPKAIKIKTKINKWDLIKFTSFCTAKTKRQPEDWEKVFANDGTNKDFKKRNKNKTKQGLNL